MKMYVPKILRVSKVLLDTELLTVHLMVKRCQEQEFRLGVPLISQLLFFYFSSFYLFLDFKLLWTETCFVLCKTPVIVRCYITKLGKHLPILCIEYPHIP